MGRPRPPQVAALLLGLVVSVGLGVAALRLVPGLRTLGLIERMRVACAEAGVPLVVVRLAACDDGWVAAAPRIETLDLRGLPRPTLPGDAHPTAAWHAAVAEAIDRRTGPLAPERGPSPAAARQPFRYRPEGKTRGRQDAA